MPSRFGIFLGTIPRIPDVGHTVPDAEDFLAAELEGSPSSPTPYLNLARTYAEERRISDAQSEYEHALELAPFRSSHRR